MARKYWNRIDLVKCDFWACRNRSQQTMRRNSTKNEKVSILFIFISHINMSKKWNWTCSCLCDACITDSRKVHNEPHSDTHSPTLTYFDSSEFCRLSLYKPVFSVEDAYTVCSIEYKTTTTKNSANHPYGKIIKKNVSHWMVQLRWL